MIVLTDSLVAALNAQMNMEAAAETFYRQLAANCEMDTVNLPGFRHFFKHEARKENAHTKKVEHYLIDRQGPITFAPSMLSVAIPSPMGMRSMAYAVAAVSAAQQAEAAVSDSLDDLYDLAETVGDTDVCIFLQKMIRNQVDDEKELLDLARQLADSDTNASLKLIDKKLKKI